MTGIVALTCSSIHEFSPVSTGDTAVANKKKWAVLWRSIISSSLASTMYPYCLWIKSLSLGNLQDLLQDLARDVYRDTRSWFFSSPLEKFHVFDGNVVTRRKRAHMDIDRIIIDVTSQVTDFIKKSATEEDKTVGLTALEGYYLPTASLPGWVSSLSLLTSLTVRDGSVLNSEVSEAIRKNCPQFKELMCFFCKGDGVDQDMAGFLNGLAPNTLETFTIMSHNATGAKTYAALGRHSSSLRLLSLSVEDAVADLPLLSDCTNIVDLSLAVSRTFEPGWEHSHKQEVGKIASWLQQCTALKALCVSDLPATPTILAEVLKNPKIKLRDLDVTIQTSYEDTTGFSAALETQTGLLGFTFRSNDGCFGGAEFVHAVCQCTKLRELDIITQMLTPAEFMKLTRTLTDLEEFGFDIDYEEPIGNECTSSIADMHKLKTLNINATTNFTYPGLLWLLERLDKDPPGSHRGLSISVMRQSGTEKFSKADERKLNDEIDKRFGGKIDITYDRDDPDELNESDFSD